MIAELVAKRITKGNEEYMINQISMRLLNLGYKRAQIKTLMKDKVFVSDVLGFVRARVTMSDTMSWAMGESL